MFDRKWWRWWWCWWVLFVWLEEKVGWIGSGRVFVYVVWIFIIIFAQAHWLCINWIDDNDKNIESNGRDWLIEGKKYKHSNNNASHGMAWHGLLPVVFIAIFALRFRNNSLIKYKTTCSHKRAHKAHCIGDTHDCVHTHTQCACQ